MLANLSEIDGVKRRLSQQDIDTRSRRIIGGWTAIAEKKIVKMSKTGWIREDTKRIATTHGNTELAAFQELEIVVGLLKIQEALG